MIIQKTPEQIDKMAAAGDVLVRTMALLESKIRPGVTTKELDEAAEKFIRSQGAVPSFKGYNGFRGSICASPNHMVVHGIPGDFELKRGDVVSDQRPIRTQGSGHVMLQRDAETIDIASAPPVRWRATTTCRRPRRTSTDGRAGTRRPLPRTGRRSRWSATRRSAPTSSGGSVR